MNKPEPIKETEQNIQGEAYLDTVEPGHWPRGVFYPDAYVIQSDVHHIRPGKALTSAQNVRGIALAERLQARMQAIILADGWRPVAQTREGLAIWQHRPGAKHAPAQPAILEQEHGIVESDLERQSRTRTVYTRSITFTCAWCKQQVTEQRYPSHTPLYCSKPACKQEATRVKTRERVASWRKAHPDARRKKKV